MHKCVHISENEVSLLGKNVLFLLLMIREIFLEVQKDTLQQFSPLSLQKQL